MRLFAEKLDVAFGNRGNQPFGTKPYIEEEDLKYLQEAEEYTDDETATLKAYVEANFTDNPEQLLEGDLTFPLIVRNISYIQTDAQQVANDLITVRDKVNAMLAKLRLSNIIED